MKTFFTFIGLIVVFNFTACQPSIDVSVETDFNKIVVGVFNGNGAGATSVIETIEALKIDKKIKPVAISAAQIMNGELNDIDALIFPGGSGSKELNNLGKLGQQKVKDFVIKDGKGVIGICAGAYLFCSTPGYPSLQLADVKHIDRAHYNRGRGLIAFQLTSEGEKIFPELKGKHQFAQYYDGPVMEALHTEKSFSKLASYVTDIHPKKGTPEGITPGKIFIYNQELGKGRLFAIAGHTESTPGMRWMIPRMARWVTRSELVSYPAKWIDPNRNTHAILFDSENQKLEKKLWWKLFDNNPAVQIAAIDSLYDLRSRPAVRWNIGLLRNDNPEVRAHAAQMVAKTEYTDALHDLNIALETEQNQEAKQALKDAIDFLKF